MMLNCKHGNAYYIDKKAVLKQKICFRTAFRIINAFSAILNLV